MGFGVYLCWPNQTDRNFVCTEELKETEQARILSVDY